MTVKIGYRESRWGYQPLQVQVDAGPVCELSSANVCKFLFAYIPGYQGPLTMQDRIDNCRAILGEN